jgi:hypothetical protein
MPRLKLGMTMPGSSRWVLLAVAAVLAAGSARAAPPDLSRFDVRNVHTWAERLVLCDATAFLATRPDFNANRIWVRREDGHRDLLLPPDFIGAGRWYAEGYERLYRKLEHEGKVDEASLQTAEDSLGLPLVRAYRVSGYGWVGMSFLRDQDTFCRAMARRNGVIVD